MEIWKPIKNWEDKYEVSNKGRIKNSTTGKILKGDKNNCGYCRISFYDKSRKERVFIHRLVLMTFSPVDNMENLQVNHIDGNKENNSLENLEWVTQIENEMHAIKLGLKGVWHGDFKVIYTDGRVEIHDNKRNFARQIGTSHTQVRNWLDKGVKTYIKYNIQEMYYCDK